jgi:hypothetical protein
MIPLPRTDTRVPNSVAQPLPSHFLFFIEAIPMTDPRVAQIADVLVHYALDIQSGETHHITACATADFLPTASSSTKVVHNTQPDWFTPHSDLINKNYSILKRRKLYNLIYK